MKDENVTVYPELDALPAPPDIEDFLAEDFPPDQQIIGPVRTGNIAICAAQAGVGKTNLAHAIGAAVANGRDLMHWHVPEPRRVLLVDGELPGRQLQDRLRRFHWRDDRAAFDVVSGISWASRYDLGLPNLADPGWQDWLAERAQGCGLVALDNVMSLIHAPGVSFSSDEFWRAVNPLNLRLRAQGCAVLWIDHANGQDEIFGTKTKTWHADLVFTLKSDADALDSEREGRCLFTLAFKKVRGERGPDHRSMNVEMTTGPDGLMHWHAESAVLAEMEQAHELRASGLKQRQIAEAMGVSVGKVNKLLKRHDEREAYRHARG